MADETVLELAAGLGNSVIALAKRYNIQAVGIEKDPNLVAKARAKARSAGLSDRVKFIEKTIINYHKL
ncbi:methyltransferase domain-containing protein [Halotia branconii]|uniref:Methyltransferase domain-containing protein n=1 Tax=Halotia branconii CENA392 TaxID=1539056 RepID=A0AAJ6NY70_9CYAN|nr:methyltransferase domain-containing protein [Halotia branconii]WGV28924.1 methyltransferase domain-containing protein [Halotia branconii CENA392]